MTLSPYEKPAGTDLVTWAEEANQVHQIAKILANTSFVPRAMQGRPDEIAAQMLYGREINMPPMVSLAQINVIEGRASLSALAMRGLAQANSIKFRLEESTETRCKYSAIAPGDSSWTTVTWTMDRARKLGLDGKANWKKQPQAMLVARATSELCRLVAAPLFLGLSYSSEELKDGADDITELYDHVSNDAPRESSNEPPPPPAKTMRREPVKATATVPRSEQRAIKATPAEVGYDERNIADVPLGAEVDRLDMVTQTTRQRLMIQFREAGILERVPRLAYVSDLLKREVHSVNQITEDEGKQIIVQLHADYPKVTKDPDEWDDVQPAEVGHG